MRWATGQLLSLLMSSTGFQEMGGIMLAKFGGTTTTHMEQSTLDVVTGNEASPELYTIVGLVTVSLLAVCIIVIYIWLLWNDEELNQYLEYYVQSIAARISKKKKKVRQFESPMDQYSSYDSYRLSDNSLPNFRVSSVDDELDKNSPEVVEAMCQILEELQKGLELVQKKLAHFDIADLKKLQNHFNFLSSHYNRYLEFYEVFVEAGSSSEDAKYVYYTKGIDIHEQITRKFDEFKILK